MTYISFKKSIILLAHIVLIGCATSNVSNKTDFNENSNSGLVIGSFTQDKSGSAYTRYHMQSENKSSKPKVLHSREQNLAGLMPGFVKSEFDGTDGRLFSINLAPGTYKFTNWDVNIGTNNYYPVQAPDALKFKVNAGEIVYLGNIHMHFPGDGMYPVINNESARDIALFKQKYPNFTNYTIKIRPLSQGPWHSESNLNNTVPIEEKPRFK